MEKKKWIIFASVILLVMIVGGVLLSNPKVLNAANAFENKKEKNNETYVSETEKKKKYTDYYSGIIISDENEVISNVPFIDDDTIPFGIGTDQSRFEKYNCLPSCFGDFYIKENGLPGAVMRERSDGSRYLVYDIKGGYRLFAFLGLDWQKSEMPVLVGYPIIYKNRLSYSDFSEVQIGDTISKVNTIDDVCSIYSEIISFGVSNGLYEIKIKDGEALHSVHYLTNGLLLFEYGALNENGDPVVTSINYYPDYLIMTVSGKMVNYRINPLDLPQ